MIIRIGRNKDKKKNGATRIQFSVFTLYGRGNEAIEEEICVLELHGFRLLKYLDGDAGNVNFLIEAPEGYMFYRE